MEMSRSVRAGSSQKRASIIAAARDLFLRTGYERCSLDGVAAQAKVSKRTVYDYYGDKHHLLLAVLDDAGQSLLAAVRSAIEQELRDVADVAELEAALVGFARRVATDTFSSSDYAVVQRLIAAEGARLPGSVRGWLTSAPEDALAERFAALTRDGLLDAPNPRLAADHFVALTFLLALDNVIPGAAVDEARVEQAIRDGVPAFLRAYAPTIVAPLTTPT